MKSGNDLAAQRVDDLPEQEVVRLVVAEADAGGGLERHLLHGGPRVRLVVARHRAGVRVHDVGQSRLVRQELTNRDGAPRLRETVDVARDRGGEVDLAGVDELHDRDAHERLRDRVDGEGRLPRDGHGVLHVREPELAVIRDHAVAHDGDLESGDAALRHLAADERLERGTIQGGVRVLRMRADSERGRRERGESGATRESHHVLEECGLHE